METSYKRVTLSSTTSASSNRGREHTLVSFHKQNRVTESSQTHTLFWIRTSETEMNSTCNRLLISILMSNYQTTVK